MLLFYDFETACFQSEKWLSEGQRRAQEGEADPEVEEQDRGGGQGLRGLRGRGVPETRRRARPLRARHGTRQGPKCQDGI